MLFCYIFFFFNDTATTEIYTLSLHDALPICDVHSLVRDRLAQVVGSPLDRIPEGAPLPVTHDSNFSGAYMRFALEQSLRRLRTDCIDLLQLHNPPLNLISRLETYEALEDLKREGKIRFHGVSVHPPEEGLAAIHATLPDTVQIVYNLARREAEEEFLPAARAANVGVIAREPLANGLDRKSTRLNSSHSQISYAVFCLKKKKNAQT